MNAWWLDRLGRKLGNEHLLRLGFRESEYTEEENGNEVIKSYVVKRIPSADGAVHEYDCGQ